MGGVPFHTERHGEGGGENMVENWMADRGRAPAGNQLVICGPPGLADKRTSMGQKSILRPGRAGEKNPGAPSTESQDRGPTPEGGENFRGKSARAGKKG